MSEVNSPPFRPEAITRESLGVENLVLQGADLRNTDLSGAQQLLSRQLAGTDLSGAVLPPHLQLDEKLSLVENLSKNARNIFLSTIFACIYSWLTLATTSDMALIGNSVSSALPIINTAIPIVGFYWIAPLLLLGLYFYLHLYLQRLWDVLAELPAVFPDGSSLDKKIYPWLLSGLVRSHLNQLKQQHPRFSRLQVGLSIFLAWWLVPITFLVFWIGYFPRHDGYGTALHTVVLVAAVYAGTRFYVGAKDTLSRRQKLLFDWKEAYKNRRCYQQGGMILGISLLLGSLSFSVVHAVPSDAREKIGLSSINPRVWLPGALQWLGIKVFPELTEAQFSIKPEAWDESGDNDELIARVKGARLQGVQLAHVNISGAFLVNADLRGANLAWADLRQVDLRGARLDGANLHGANLQGALVKGISLRGVDLRLVNLNDIPGISHDSTYFEDLREVSFANTNIKSINFSKKNLEDANFQGANLNNVSFIRAKLASANFGGATLKNVDFRGANLADANFQGANFEEHTLFLNANLIRTNFKGVKGLTSAMFLTPWGSKTPANWVFAIFNDEILTKVGLPLDHNHKISEKNLQAYNLRNAKFKNADLKQFDFHGADLGNAEFYNTDLSGTNLQKVNLKGVIISNVNFQGTKLKGADLENAHLRKVNFTSIDLRNVNFKGANFKGSKIIESHLEGANFENTHWDNGLGVSYIKTDLRGTTGLTCSHMSDMDLVIAQESQLPNALKICDKAASTGK